MPYCPNCNAKLDPQSLKARACWNCDADFGKEAQWRPTHLPSGRFRKLKAETQAQVRLQPEHQTSPVLKALLAALFLTVLTFSVGLSALRDFKNEVRSGVIELEFEISEQQEIYKTVLLRRSERPALFWVHELKYVAATIGVLFITIVTWVAFSLHITRGFPEIPPDHPLKSELQVLIYTALVCALYFCCAHFGVVLLHPWLFP
ncbi:hypothetical protein LRS03_25920 [Rhizobacter sp. J219]|uniref:hypothetical protein n=1 Tax=Rhizobacter sp. J219 TaxID=2898430 RepID=UPI00215097E0|nr:hypothetical protein [Rhizobacter sp. J219]MCR5886103.1 hypothetical protein [Rhizobacter sp. J219]